MTIGINILYLIPNQVGGTEYYARSLIDALQKNDNTNTYYVFCNKETSSKLQLINPKWQKIECAVHGKDKVTRILFEQCVLPLLAQKYRCTVLHSLGYSSPAFGTFSKITSVHDANWRDHPSDDNWFYNAIANIIYGSSMRFSDLILTDSHFSKTRIVAFFPNHASKISVLSPGIDPKVITSIENARLKPEQKNPYILCVSNFYPHKQILYLLTLWEKISANSPGLELLLVGSQGKDKNKVASLVASKDTVRWFQKVSLEELGALYANAKLCIFPSIYEGFGFPVYEALVSKAPIVVGDVNLYSSLITDVLHQLSFSEDKDASLVLSLLKMNTKNTNNKKKIPTYKMSAKKLIKIYNSFEKI